MIAETLRNEIRDEDAPIDLIKENLTKLGSIMAQHLIEKYYITEKTITTPMGNTITCPVRSSKRIVVISTKDDYQYFGLGIADAFPNSKRFYMDFAGKRGIEALSCPIRGMNLEDVSDVDAVIVAKSVLATGCTAITLTKRAIEKYDPRIVIIASVYYSEQGACEVQEKCKNAMIYSFGLAEELREDGMLIPGFGDLDKRLNLDIAPGHSERHKFAIRCHRAKKLRKSAPNSEARE